MQENKFAIIVSYRDRQQHLNQFIPHMKARFKNADIYIIEQEQGKPFNRGKLLNVGILEALGYEYYALHDVDMLPIQADYSAPEIPTLLATKAEQFGYKMPFAEYFGGVVLISGEHMKQCNGYHNEFWSWGGEDCSFRNRILSTVGSVDIRDGTFKSLPHARKIDQINYPKNLKLLKSGVDMDNGLTNCKYELIKTTELNGYKIIKVSI